VRFRLLTAAALAAVAVVGLTACDSKVGQAAVVGGHRISEHEVSDYVTRNGPDPAVASQVQGTVEPRVQALTALIQEQLFTELLQDTGGMPAAARINALIPEVAKQQYGQSESQLRTRVSQLGLSRSFADLLLRVGALEGILGQRSKLQSVDDFNRLVDKYNIAITVSPRYGKWVPSKVQLSGNAHAGVPGFVKLLPTTAPAQ